MKAAKRSFRVNGWKTALKKADLKLEETTKESKIDSWLNHRMSHWRKKYIKFRKKGKMGRWSKEKGRPM